jgi:hypothetical protein
MAAFAPARANVIPSGSFSPARFALVAVPERLSRQGLTRRRGNLPFIECVAAIAAKASSQLVSRNSGGAHGDYPALREGVGFQLTSKRRAERTA